MILTGTLSRYFVRQFLTWFGLLMVVLLLLVYLIDTVELLRRAAGKPDVTLAMILRMGLFKLPGVGQQIIPFAILFSAMFSFWRLTRSNELAVVRSAGISVWQFVGPLVLAALLVGVVKVTVINPMGAMMIAQYAQLEDRLFKGRSSGLDLMHSGLWLRQASGDSQYLIHAESVAPGAELRSVLMMRLGADDRLEARIDAASAQLLPGRWEVRDGWLRPVGRPARYFAFQEIPSDLTMDQLEENFAAPDTISFWRLPYFIKVMENTGFSAIRHRLYLQSLLSQPLLYCSMVLLAAAFSMRQSRRGGTLMMVSGGVVSGFALFVMNNLVLSLAVSEAIPVPLAAWTPATVSLLLGVTALLHLEDG